jgi:hypothetical protein
MMNWIGRESSCIYLEIKILCQPLAGADKGHHERTQDSRSPGLFQTGTS